MVCFDADHDVLIVQQLVLICCSNFVFSNFAVTCLVGGWLLSSYYDYLSRLELKLFKVNCHSHVGFFWLADAGVNKSCNCEFHSCKT